MNVVAALLSLGLMVQPFTGDVPDAHPLGTDWAVQDFSYRVAAAEYEEVCEKSAEAPQMSAEDQALCEAACQEEVCGCETPVRYLGEFTAYAYCGCANCTPGNMVTASGTAPKKGRTVAVDPDVIPLGTNLRLEYPDGRTDRVIAEDTGSSINGNKLDLYMDRHSEAIEFGVRKVKVYKEESK